MSPAASPGGGDGEPVQATQIRAVFLGAPGAGKGTQAKQMVERFGTPHVSSGDMLRDHRERGTELGRQAKGYMDGGELVPDDLIIAMVMDRITQPGHATWILDGFPRNLAQARSLDQSFADAKEVGPGLSHVVYFEVPHEILVGRLTGRRTCSQCGAIWHCEFKPTQKAGQCDLCDGELTQRPDDRVEVVQTRLDEYRKQTEPLLEYYRSKGVLVEVDANRSPDEVFEELITSLEIQHPAS